MRILTSIVQPAACFLFVGITDDLHRDTVRPHFVCHNHIRLRTPVETMIEGKEIWKEKFVDQI